MRNRAARVLIVVALAAGVAMAGAAAPHWGMRHTLRHLTHTAAMPANAAATALSRTAGGSTADSGAAAMDALLAPAAVLAIGMLMRLRRVQAARSTVRATQCGGGCRAPPGGPL